MSPSAEHGGPARSDRLNHIAPALVRVQGRLDPVVADEVASVHDGFEERTYRYATLAGVWAAIRPALLAEELAVVQTCDGGDRDELRLTTTLFHKSGQWIAGTIAMHLPGQTPQAYGSALTYARRYGLAALLGIAVDTDDDGALAGVPPPSRAATAASASNAPAPGKGAWWKVPCNEASREDWDEFLLAFAKATQVESATRADVARLLGVPEDRELADHFGSHPLGELIPAARKARPRSRATGTEANSVSPPEPWAA